MDHITSAEARRIGTSVHRDLLDGKSIYETVLFPIADVAGESFEERQAREEARQQLIDRFDPRRGG